MVTINANQSMSNARNIRGGINRAKSYLLRSDLVKSMESIVEVLLEKQNLPVIGPGKQEVDNSLRDYCDEFNRNPQVLTLLQSFNVVNKKYLNYKSGQDDLIINKISALKLKMVQVEENEKQRARGEELAKCESLIAQGKAAIEAKDLPKARVSLKRAAEQYGHEPGVLARVGEIMVAGGSPKEAVDILRKALELFPKVAKPYKLLLDAHLALGNLGDAEAVYLDVIRQFGEHPLTLLNLAKLYLKMRKREKASDAAHRAYRLDPSLTEAKEIWERY